MPCHSHSVVWSIFLLTADHVPFPPTVAYPLIWYPIMLSVPQMSSDTSSDFDSPRTRGVAGDAEVLDLNLDEVPLEMLVDDEGEEGKEDPKGKGPARDPSRRGCTVSV